MLVQKQLKALPVWSLPPRWLPNWSSWTPGATFQFPTSLSLSHYLAKPSASRHTFQDSHRQPLCVAVMHWAASKGTWRYCSNRHGWHIWNCLVETFNILIFATSSKDTPPLPVLVWCARLLRKWAAVDLVWREAHDKSFAPTLHIDGFTFSGGPHALVVSSY